MVERPPPRPTPTSVAEALAVAAADAAGTMRGRASRALAGLDALAVETRRRRRVRRVVLAMGIAALVGAGVLRLVDPPVPLGDRLADAIAAGDGDAVGGLIADGALEELDRARPAEAMRLAAATCDLAMLGRLADAGARRFADGRIREDAALSAAIRSCPRGVIEAVWEGSPSNAPPIHLMAFVAAEGSPAAVRTLAGLGFPLDGADGAAGPSPLEAAIRAGRADTAHALVALGADTRLRTADGEQLAVLLARLPSAADCAALAASSTAAWRDECASILHGGRP